MLCLKLIKLVPFKGKVDKGFNLYIGELLLGVIRPNVFKIKSDKPYLFTWHIKFPNYERHNLLVMDQLDMSDNALFYADSPEECRERAEEVLREFLAQVLQ